MKADCTEWPGKSCNSLNKKDSADFYQIRTDRPTIHCRGKEIQVTQKTLNDHIESRPEIAGDKPRIAGHRITVQNIVIWHERMGRTADEIAADYGLSLADVYAALAYYHDHQFEIEKSIKDGKRFAEELRQKTPSKIGRRMYEREGKVLYG